MKLSQFNVVVDLNQNYTVLYNTFSRDYFLMNEAMKNTFLELEKGLHKDDYSEEEAALVTQLARNKFILRNETNELEQIRAKENDLKKQQQTHIVVFKTTLDCNFRCTYCNQFHEPIKMTDHVANEVIQYITEASKQYRKIQFVWFGGEPLLEVEQMKRMSKKMIDACSANNCEYSAAMTTNGYLLNESILGYLDEMRIRKVQITLDGTEKHHNLARPHSDGSGTFDVVYNNILKVLMSAIEVNLRINVNQENYADIAHLLDLIPRTYRKKVKLSMANWFQTNPKLSLFELYENAIKKGYPFMRVKNSFGVCERTFDNTVSILPNGRVVCCSEEYQVDASFGTIAQGKLNVEQEETLEKLVGRKSITENERCKKCIELPMCMGGCIKARVNQKNYCAKFVPDGLSVEEKVKLHVYSDMKFKPEVIKTL